MANAFHFSGKRGSAKPIRLPKVVRHRDWEKLISAGRNSLERAYIGVGLYAGLRASENCNLDRGDIDFADEQIHVRHGKGDKEAYVYLHPRAAELLQEYLAERRTPKASVAGDPIYVTERYTRLSRVQAWRIVKGAGERSGLGKIWTHVLRHSCATRMLERGARIIVVRDHLRHSSAATTEIYLHLANPELKQAAMDM